MDLDINKFGTGCTLLAQFVLSFTAYCLSLFILTQIKIDVPHQQETLNYSRITSPVSY
jgi:hypothetical protein